MAEVVQTFLVSIFGMVVHKNREVKKDYGIEEGSVNVGCKDNFVKY